MRSREPETIWRLSAENATVFTSEVWPVNLTYARWDRETRTHRKIDNPKHVAEGSKIRCTANSSETLGSTT